MELTHFDDMGNAHMVDVSEKEVTKRSAVASGIIEMEMETLQVILDKGISKGDVLTVAQTAGISAVKRTWELIPLCHIVMIRNVEITFNTENGGYIDTNDKRDVTGEKSESKGIIKVTCTIRGEDKTGFEMEALTGVSVTLLTIYDMCKAIDRGMEIKNIRLDYKDGGKSGEFKR